MRRPSVIRAVLDRRSVAGSGARIQSRAPAALVARAASVLFAAVLLMLAVSPAGAASVTRASVDGHRSLRARDVLDILSAGEGSVFDLSEVDAGVDSLIVLLAGLGRPFARVSVSWDSTAAGVTVAVSVDEGPEISLHDLTFRGVAGPLPDEFVRGLNLRPGSYVTAIC